MEQPIDLLKQKVEMWRQNGRCLSVVVVGKDCTEVAEVYVRDWTPRQRRVRAMKSLVLWWGIGLFTAIIPLLHFFLVPAFFMVGLVVFFSIRNMERTILGGVGGCPYCGKQFEISGHRDRWPMDDICDSCHRHVQIQKTDSTDNLADASS